MIGVKPLFSGSALSQGANAGFDVVARRRRRKPLTQKGSRYELLKVDSQISVVPQKRLEYEPIKTTQRVADGTLDMAADAPGQHLAPGCMGPLPFAGFEPGTDGPATSIGFDAGCYAEAGADTPDRLEVALDKPEYKRGDTMTVAVTARSRWNAHGKCLRRCGCSIDHPVTFVKARPKFRSSVGTRLGRGAYVVATLLRSAR